MSESVTQPFYWSLRRELWENRSIYIAPVIVALVLLFGFVIGMHTLPSRMIVAADLGHTGERAVLARPYAIAAYLMVVIAFILGVFYCLDALHGERRDRSILFWKSLPVSDRMIVLSKASIPLVVLPLFIFAIIVAIQLMMLLLSTLALLGNGPSLMTLWAQLPLIKMALALIYALIAIALWHAPIYGWLLLVSGWAKRAAFLWAILPVMTILFFETIAFRTTHFARMLGYRIFGWFTQAFTEQARDSFAAEPLRSLDPLKFISTPGLWIGLLFAALFIAAAVRLRRDRERI
jgi:ABC-2 type transport system permease protein